MLTSELLLGLGANKRDGEILRAIAEGAELIRNYVLSGGDEVATSPLYAFEQPDQLVAIFESHSADQVRLSFERVRAQPGLPLLMDGGDPVIEDMVRLGLVPAPMVVGADNRRRAFVILPYGLDPVYLTVKKQVLERALAIIACIRCGEVSGGASSVSMPDRLLYRLADSARNYTLTPHSSTARQYAPLIRMGVVRAIPIGDRHAARLIPTPDNLEAVSLARSLLQRKGDGLPERGNEQEAAGLLFTGGDYLAPIETISKARLQTVPRLSDSEVENVWFRAMGWGL